MSVNFLSIRVEPIFGIFLKQELVKNFGKFGNFKNFKNLNNSATK